MKKYYIYGGTTAFVVIFNLGYLFHEIIAGKFFKDNIGHIQRNEYIIPLIALAFLLYIIFQAYFLPVFYNHTKTKYNWTLLKSAIIFGIVIGFFWDGLQGGIIEIATFKMPAIVFWIDSGYHTIEGIIASLILSFFYRKYYPL